MSDSQGWSDGTKIKRSRTRTACDSCRAYKSKCDGADPCGACCRAKMQRPKPCKYSQHSNDDAKPTSERMDQGLFTLPRRGSWMSPSGLKMYHHFSLHRVVDDFVTSRPRKGKVGRQIERIRRLFSGSLRLMEGDRTYTTPPSIELPPRYSSAVNQARSIQGVSPQTSEQHSVHEKLVICESYLVTSIEQEIEQGRFAEAWIAVATAMRELETVHIEHGLVIAEEEEFDSLVKTMCLKLINWDCTLSFLVGGSCQWSSWSRGRFLSSMVRQLRFDNNVFASKLDLHHDIQDLFEIDLVHEEGLYKLLKWIIDLQRHRDDEQPAIKIQQVATRMPAEGSVEEQELYFLGNLVLVILHCRVALIYADYKESRRQDLSEHLLGLLEQTELQPNKIRKQIIKHAGYAFDSFGRLYQLDRDGTTKNWFRIHGVLAAVTVAAIAASDARGARKELITQQVCQIQQVFGEMRPGINCGPLIEKGIAILEQCLMVGARFRSDVEGRKTCKQSRKRSRDYLPLSDSCLASRGISSEETELEDGYIAETPDEFDRMRDRGLPNSTKVRRRGKFSTSVHGTLPQKEEQEMSFDPSCSTNCSFTTAYEHLSKEQSDLPSNANNMNVDPGSSFTSNSGTFIAQSPLINCYTSDSLDPLPHDIPPSPSYAWPVRSPQEKLKIFYTGYPGWPDEYLAFDQNRFMVLTNEGMFDNGPRTYQQYFSQGPEANHDVQTPIPAPGSFRQYNTNSIEAPEPTAVPFEPGLTVSSQSMTQFGMEQASNLGIGEQAYYTQAYQQGFGGYNTAASTFGQGGGFDEVY